MKRIGLISDTHGLLRPEAVSFLAGCDHIIHAGDIGSTKILGQLAAIAPITAVRGNNDRDAWANEVPETALLAFENDEHAATHVQRMPPRRAHRSEPAKPSTVVRIYTIHDIAQLDIDPVESGVHVVVSGHSHKPGVREHDGVLYVNPGSAGPRRFKLPVAVAELSIAGNAMRPRIVTLTV